MAQRKEIGQFLLDDGTPLLIEVEETSSSSVQRVSREDLHREVIKAKQSFEQSLDRVIPFASAALNRFRRGLDRVVRFPQ